VYLYVYRSMHTVVQHCCCLAAMPAHMNCLKVFGLGSACSASSAADIQTGCADHKRGQWAPVGGCLCMIRAHSCCAAGVSGFSAHTLWLDCAYARVIMSAAYSGSLCVCAATPAVWCV
jgi:hypothetical protein